MDENLELEAAELELSESLRLEQEKRKQQIGALSNFDLGFGDIIIGLTAVIFLIGSLCSLLAAVFMLVDAPSGMFWLSLFPTALCSLGIALALFRVLRMTIKDKDTTSKSRIDC